jgi:hypothetical protein
MAIESVTANAGTGGADFAVDTITGSVQVPYVKLMSGTDAAEDLIGGDATNGLDVDVTRVSGTVAVSNAGLTELAAAINASSQMDVNIAASAATVAVSNAGLTELAAAINASSQMDVNLAASNATVTVSNAGLTALNGAISGTEVQVDVLTMPSVAVTNAGTFAVQVDGSALTALQVIDNPVIVDDAAFTPGTTSVTMAGFEADEGSTDSVDEGDGGAARMTLDRKVIVNPQPHTTGGLSIFRSIDLDETEEDVKTSAGQVYGWFIANLATSTRFVKFYNATAANVIVGTTAPVLTLPIPGNSSDDVAANALGGMGIAFDTAICVASTTGVADNDTGAPGANEVVINIFYK